MASWSSYGECSSSRERITRLVRPFHTIHFLLRFFFLRLHRKLWSITLKVQNVGTTLGTEIPQLYLSFPSSSNYYYTPPRLLKGFESVLLNAGETETVRFELSRYDLSVWSEEENAWIAPERNGRYEVFVGASSRDFRLRGSFTLI